MNFIDELMFHSRMQPERAAIVLADGRYVSWRQFGEGVTAARAMLERRDVNRTDLVSLEISDPIFRLTTLCALLRMGVCVVNSGAETTALAGRLGARIFLCDSEGMPPAGVLPGDVRIVSVNEDWFVPRPDRSTVLPEGKNEEQISYAAGLPAVVFFTSGTTGVPAARGMSFKHFNLSLNRKRFVLDRIVCTRVLIVPDMTSSAGTIVAYASLMSGRTIFLVKTAHVPKAVGLYRIEMIAATPYIINAITDTLKRHPFDFQPVQGVRFGGGAVSRELLFDVARLISPNISFNYAATEAGTVAELPQPVFGHAAGMAGQPAPGVKVMIVDEDGCEVMPGESGEIRIQTDHAAMPFVSATQRVEPGPDHWFESGDLGHIDPDGNLVVSGRKSDVINLGGAKFLPEIVEDFLRQEKGIDDAAAISIQPRDGMIEEMHIFIVTKARSHDELKQDLHVKLGFARPHKLHLIEAIPRNRLGKIARGELRAIARGDSRPLAPGSN